MIDFSPGRADGETEGAVFDLPIAIAVLLAMGKIEKTDIKDFAFTGELSLSGNITSICGVLPIAISAKSLNIQNLIVPEGNAQEASIVEGINIIPANNIIAVLKHITKQKLIKYSTPKDFSFKNN